MNPNFFKNLTSASSLLVVVASQSTLFATPVIYLEGISLDSGYTSGLLPLPNGTRDGIALHSDNGGVVLYSPVSETARGSYDGGVTLYGKPVSVVLGADMETNTGTFDIWDMEQYFTSSASPVFRIDTVTDTAVFKSLNVSITGGSLSVSGGLNLVGTGSANGLSVNGASIFSIDTAGQVNYAAGRPVSITSTTPSSGSVSGALVVSGGIGVAKDSFINGIRIGRGVGDVSTNAVFGGNALSGANTGNSQVAFGYNALVANTGGHTNTAVGASSLSSNTNGVSNTAVGANALRDVVTGNYNAGLGHSAGLNNTTGTFNVFLGNGAGALQSNLSPLTDPETSIYIGANARGNNSDSNSIVIGNVAISEGANVTVLGNKITEKAHIFGQTTLTNTPWKTRTAGVSPLADPTTATSDSEGEALVVEGHTRLKGMVIIEQPQGDITMGIYE